MSSLTETLASPAPAVAGLVIVGLTLALCGIAAFVVIWGR